MKKFVLNHRKQWCIGLSVYQILGALVAIIFLLSIVKNNMYPGVIIVLIPIATICIVSLLAGVLFFRGNESRFFTLSKVSFWVQILQLSLGGFGFIFYYGPYLAVGFDNDSKFLMKFESLSCNFSIELGDTSEQYVLLNLVPVFLLITLRWLQRNPIVSSPELENAFVEES